MDFNNDNNQPVAPSVIPPISVTPALVDTSVIIDGRIADIARAGFAPGKLLIPRFVLAELQLIADSGDAMKRSRGRRGLEMLNTMRQSGVDMEIIEYDYDDIREVDAKLVRLGRHLKVSVLTTDYNLNRVASIEGVRVLNINELANAVRPVVVPGEYMMVKIVQPGKEKSQGVGYLADGTMIVVDNGDKLMGQEVECEITRVFQTVAGKMLFAAPVKAATGRSNDRGGRKNQVQRAQTTPTSPPIIPSGIQPTIIAAPPLSDPTQPTSPQKPQGQGQQRKSRGGSQNNPPRNRNQTTDQRRGGQSTGSNGRRSKRISPTQKLENSLLEMTSSEGDQTKS
jgi:rRNA-processing protein FCF1